MARVVGVDIGGSHVRAVLLSVSSRRSTVERMEEVALGAFGSTEEALATVVRPLLEHGEALVSSVSGVDVLTHRIALPPTASKQLAEVLPYEIEALVPIDIDELVYDHKVLRGGSRDAISILASCCRTTVVERLIQLFARAAGREPERVGAGAAGLANLASVSAQLRAPGCVAVLHLGSKLTDLVILEDGELGFMRTLSWGTEQLPERAEQLVTAARQSLLFWLDQTGRQVTQVYLVGSGVSAPGAVEYLSSGLGVPAGVLPPPAIECSLPLMQESLPRYAKALGCALSLAYRPRDFDLRRGALAFQRGYGFLKQRAPLLIGFAAAIFISFVFSTGARLHALKLEHDSLEASLASVSRSVLGEEAVDAEGAALLLEKALSEEEKDPMPLLDGVDVLLELSNAIPSTITHDIEAFDLQRGKVRVNGVLGTADEAQQILSNLKQHRCIKDATVSKITQAINSDRKKYVLEFLVVCPEEEPKKKPKSGSTAREEVSP